MMNRINKAIDWFARCLNRHPKVNVTLTVLFPLLFSLGNTYVGRAVGWVTANGLTLGGAILNIIVFIAYLFFSFANKNIFTIIEDEENATKAYQLLLKNLNMICNNKIINISNAISKSIEESANSIAYDYNLQLTFICTSISQYICRTTEIKNEQIVVSILYRLNSAQPWRWSDKSSIKVNTTFDEIKSLVSNKCSTFYNVMHDNMPNCIIYNDKNKAISDNCYVPDTYDRTYKNNGSIACYLMSFTYNQSKVEAVLSISTYGQKFVEQGVLSEDDYEASISAFQDNLKDMIFPNFEPRIQIELINMLVDKLKTGKLSLL